MTVITNTFPRTPEAFIAKWRAAELKERSAAQEHFIDLCRLLDEPTPAEDDPTGERYCFERGATKTTGGEGWADVWRRGRFGWEYKGKRKDLNAAFAQLQQYALALENPPILVACDLERFMIRTNWTNTVSRAFDFTLEDLRDARTRSVLKNVMANPEALRPGVTRQALTEEVAGEFATLAQRLRERGFEAERVAHFVNRLVFCMFADHVDLLPQKMFRRMVEAALGQPVQFETLATQLFGAMRAGGRVGFEAVSWFNGGLFDSDDALPLAGDDLKLVAKAAARDWSEVDPSILGTLFERGLDPSKRNQLGAFYTDRETIADVVEPVVVRPLAAEWARIRDEIAETLEPARAAVEDVLARASAFPELQEEVREVRTRTGASRQLDLFEVGPRQRRVRNLDEVRKDLRSADARLAAAKRDAEARYNAFLARVRGFRVLDPACGAGNFLYLALQALKDLERRVSIEGELLGFSPAFPAVGPEQLLGLELSPYAAELARVSVWIGEIQWMRRNGFDIGRDPILRPLGTIECRDALLAPDGTEAEWPKANCIVGNPPFLGDREHRKDLGGEYVEKLREVYADRVPGGADLVVYWLRKAAEKTLRGEVERFGLVATKSVAKGKSRGALDLLAGGANQLVYEAWTNRPWVVEGAAVRVSIVCAAAPGDPVLAGTSKRLNGREVARINPDLTEGVDVTRARRLAQNSRVAFQGVKLTGPFDIAGDEARALLGLPVNPNGRPNSDVVARLYDIEDILGRDSDRWVVDFGSERTETEAALYEAPFRIVTERVRPFRLDPERVRHGESRLKDKYWEFERPRPKMRRALAGKQRFIVTPESSEHRLFVFVPARLLVQGSLFAIARDDDTTFGVLSSRIHEVWATAQGNRLGVGNQRRYNVGVAFETFPFPDGMTLDLVPPLVVADVRAQRIAAAARELDRLRQNWLNPADAVRRLPEVVGDYPDRFLPVDASKAQVLAKRTLTNLYNEDPPWLRHAHRELDAAVASAYGLEPDLPDEGILEFLLGLNQRRAAEATRPVESGSPSGEPAFAKRVQRTGRRLVEALAKSPLRGEDLVLERSFVTGPVRDVEL